MHLYQLDHVKNVGLKYLTLLSNATNVKIKIKCALLLVYQLMDQMESNVRVVVNGV